MLTFRVALLGLALLLAPISLTQLAPALTIVLPQTSTAPASSPTTAPTIDPENCVYQFTVHQLLDNTKDLTVYLVREKGKFIRASAEAPTWNRSAHTVDASELVATKNRLYGPLKIKLIPDHWIPDDQEEKEITLTLKTRMAANTITGTSSITLNDENLSPKITGELLNPRDPQNLELNLSCEDALNWGEVHAQRVEFAIEFRKGKIIPLVAKSHNHKMAQESFPFDPSKIKLTDSALSGTITFTLTDEDGIAQPVEITLNAQRAGDLLYGPFTSKINKEKRTGPLRAILLPLEDKK